VKAVGARVQSLLRSLREKLRWHVNEFLIRRPALLARMGWTLTVVDAFGSPGDTLLTATVCRELKKRHPKLRLNCVTPNPSLLVLDPNIDSLNERRTLGRLRFWYLELLERKDSATNVLKSTMDVVGIRQYDYRAQVYLSSSELESARQRLEGLRRPIITINVASREKVKGWPLDNWRKLVGEISDGASVVQIGDDREPLLSGVMRLAGTLSMRESMAVLAQADLHIGPDSFLMHAANGVNTPAVIIYGGSRPPGCLGYAQNVNLAVQIECSPCWIHDSKGGKCPHDIKCMDMITPEKVLEAVESKLGVCQT